ncbi:MAG: GTP pyrophosphokinase family protein [Lachnospiraceae bacterium]|nr:GTP pyrophosphokinase family protein [Lachnospiraceae bacterium]
MKAMTQELFAETRQYQELMMMYECAIKEVQTKLEVLDEEFSVRYKRNPISNIESRVKTPMSIVRKMQKNHLEITVQNIMAGLNDVAGIRVICAFIDDIYDIARMLASQDDIRVIRIKDYIQDPKPNGYRSYHMIVEIPVFFSKSKQIMRVEVQIRTIAMNFWASLEHQLRYKKGIENIEDIDEISQELLEAAETIAQTDIKMQNIKNKIGKFTDIA